MKSSLMKSPAFRTYPVLAQSKVDGVVVLFTGLRAGIVVVAGEKECLGKFQDLWAPVVDTAFWEILPAGTEVRLFQE
jgi:hypothetical protein